MSGRRPQTDHPEGPGISSTIDEHRGGDPSPGWGGAPGWTGDACLLERAARGRRPLGAALAGCLLLLVLAGVAPGCGDRVGAGVEDPTLGEVAPRVELSPAAASIGSSFTATVSGVSTDFDASTLVSLGDGVSVVAVRPLSAYELSVDLYVAPGALPGYRALTVRGGGETLTQADALLVQAGAFSLSPAAADRGQSLRVRVDVTDIPLTEGYTWAEFGEGITTRAFTPEGESSAWAEIFIDADAPPGPRDVSVQNGPSRVVLPGGFLVERGLVAIRFDPGSVSQGEEALDYVITGYGTHFEAGRTQVGFGVGLLLDPADPGAMVVESPTRITGRVVVCRAAVPGIHDVTVLTPFDDGRFERVSAIGGVEVMEIPTSIEDAYGRVSFSFNRTVVDGRTQESVGVSASFQVVAGACGTSNGQGCAVASVPPNVPQFYPPPGCTPVSNTTIFPPAPSIDAGPSVYLEGPGGAPSIRLDKEEDTDGTFYYAPSEEVPTSAFIPGTAYSLRIPGGSGDGAVPATTIERIVVTPPSLFTVTSPDLRYAPTLNPYDSVTVTWVDEEGEPGAHTFPVSVPSLRFQTNSAIDGQLSWVAYTISPDDGAFLVPAEAISQLFPGVGRLSMSVSRIGDVYSLPGSRYSTYSSASVSFSGTFELRE